MYSQDVSEIREDLLEHIRDGYDVSSGMFRINKATKAPIDTSVADSPFPQVWMKTEINRLLEIDSKIVSSTRKLLRSIRNIEVSVNSKREMKACYWQDSLDMFGKIQIMSGMIHDMLDPNFLVQNEWFWDCCQTYLEMCFKCYLSIQFYGEKVCDLFNYKYNQFLPKILNREEIFVIGN